MSRPQGRPLLCRLFADPPVLVSGDRPQLENAAATRTIAARCESRQPCRAAL